MLAVRTRARVCVCVCVCVFFFAYACVMLLCTYGNNMRGAVSLPFVFVFQTRCYRLSPVSVRYCVRSLALTASATATARPRRPWRRRPFTRIFPVQFFFYPQLLLLLLLFFFLYTLIRCPSCSPFAYHHCFCSLFARRSAQNGWPIFFLPFFHRTRSSVIRKPDM